MTSPRDIACTTKVCYPSKAQAKKALKVMRRRDGRGADHLTYYECCHCNGWHLGNLPGYQRYTRKGGIFG